MYASKAKGSLSAKDSCERGSWAFCRAVTHTKEADESFQWAGVNKTEQFP